MRPCTSHHHACDCREQKIAVLSKAAQDAASELDSLKGEIFTQPGPVTIDQEEFDRLTTFVDRVYDACEQLGLQVGSLAAEQLQ